MVIEDEKHNPKEVRSRLREVEDFNLAMKLQDEEYKMHYEGNRNERRTVGSDVKTSKVEQLREDEEARRLRREQLRPRELSDEEYARKIAAEFDEEEKRVRQQRDWQLLEDERIAKMLSDTPHGQDFVTEQIPSSFPRDQPSSSQVSVPSAIGGIPLPGLTKQSNSLDSPVDWPAPPPSFRPLESQIPQPPPAGFISEPLISFDTPTNIAPSTYNSTNPFLIDLQPSAITVSSSYIPPPPPYSVQPEYQSEFLLPPPSDIALGIQRNPGQRQA